MSDHAGQAYRALNEACGVFGIMNPESSSLGRTLYFGLYALQHRGQESCGMAVYDNYQLRLHKEMGLVNQVFNDQLLESLHGQIGIGHTRYSTTGASNLNNAQPVVVRTPFGALTLAHNGNLTNTEHLRTFLESQRYVAAGNSDSNLMAQYIQHQLSQAKTLQEAILETFNACEGAFSVVMATGDTLIAVRDRHGLRPFCMGQMPSGALVFASETCALDIVGARYIRDIQPGEILIASMEEYYACLREHPEHHERALEKGVMQLFLNNPVPKEHLCIFETVYFARPDSQLQGKSIYQYRLDLGRRLARISKEQQGDIQADIVIPVPDSGNVAAIGYSQESGIPFAEGLIKNRYVGRTFINPTHELREQGIQLKLNPLKDVLNGKNVVVVDDSIVRGNTSRNLIRMLRQCGVRRVHLRISSSPVKFPCFYGIDMSEPSQLIANQLASVEAIRDYLEVDSLIYLTPQDMIDIAGLDTACTACFTGHYPAAAGEAG